MKSPFTGKQMKMVQEHRTLNFRKDEFEVLFHTYRCEDTGEQFEDDLFAQLNYNQVVNQYREKYSIPFPEQIIAIREKYKLSAAKMSEILGFGTNVYRQYEGGEVPSQSNAKLIHLANDPHEFNKLINYCTTIDPKTVAKTHAIIGSLLEEQKKDKLERQLEDYFLGSGAPTSYTGFRKPDLRKFTEMLVFFVERLEPWKTKMNKLLFYTDFMMYKNYGISMSGMKYRAIMMGPVPNNFNSIFEYLANKEEFDIRFVSFPDGGTGEQFKPNPNRTFDTQQFSEAELNILESVAERFENVSTNEIIEISHQEKAWIENNEGKKLIDYYYGFELQAN
ncbi:MAG: type II toxin-antitoxin system antitoxin SocA domain-containing protein [Mangrovibacterium sp.]